jgi:GT2 family glycosyltransferase
MKDEERAAVIGVVVLSYNKRGDLLLALDSIHRADYPGLTVVVVDNGSSDGSADAVAARYPGVNLVRHAENLGAAGGRNAGWKHLRRLADCGYVVFLDDDAEVTRSYFSMVAECFEAYPHAGIVAAKALTGVDTGVIMSAGMVVNLYTGFVGDIGVGEKDVGQYEHAREVQACGGFALAVRAAVFEELNGLDEQFNPYGWEEVDFCLRARRAGHRVQYEPRAVVSHKGSKAGRPPNAEYERHKVRNYFKLLARHANLMQRITCVFFVPVKWARVAWKLVRTGHGGVIFAHARGVIDGLLRPAK